MTPNTLAHAPRSHTPTPRSSRAELSRTGLRGEAFFRSHATPVQPQTPTGTIVIRDQEQPISPAAARFRLPPSLPPCTRGRGRRTDRRAPAPSSTSISSSWDGMLLRLTCAQPAASAAVRWRPPERARPGPRFPIRHAAASAADGAGAPSSPLHYDPLADLLGPDVEPGGSRAQTTSPAAEKGKPRSWVGPNGQYYRELPCPSCRGRGYTPCKECGIDRSSLNCPMCDGKGIQMCLQCGGECVIWRESIDEQPWEKVRSSSPLKVKEDDEVDKLEIRINTPKRSKRTYASPSPEVAMKISRSLKSLNAQTGLFSKHMKIIHQDPELRAQRIAAIKVQADCDSDAGCVAGKGITAGHVESQSQRKSNSGNLGTAADVVKRDTTGVTAPDQLKWALA
ncbi:hypothetical protein U9M48_017923 [Paspalum notatum var. saurae]|uniref:Uncharacterized protein n=1 Tax=Paspalum notatum var. saurae TaxID=547442 RepID=A0AAQ3T8E7_PASNO